MTNETETDVADSTIIDIEEVETPEAEVSSEDENQSEDESKGGDGEEPQENTEERLERLEREVKGKQKAIDKKTARHHALQKKFDDKNKEFEKLSASIAEQKPDVEPSIDDYETHDEYNNAVKDYIRKQAVAEAQEGMLQQQRQLQHEQIVAERNKIRTTQEVEYMADNPMYKAASNEVESYVNGLTDVGYDVLEAFSSQLYDGNVPAVIDYFGANDGENLAELGDISRMSPPRAAVEVYKIQQKLLGNPTQKKQVKPASAPAKRPKSSGKPIKDLRSGSVLENLGLK